MQNDNTQSTQKDERTQVCLFAKAPLLGRVKTRMAGRLSDSDCLQLHKDMLSHMSTMVASLPRQQYLAELHITQAHPFFDELSERYSLPQKPQIGQDLGARMSHAVVVGLQDYESVLLIGADCPLVESATIAAMREAMAHCNAAMVPALDGGYVAFMLRAYHASLFNDIVWGGDKVADTSVERMQALTWDFRMLAASPDIDRPEDLTHLSALPMLQHWANK